MEEVLAETTKDIAKVVKILKQKPKAEICLFKNQDRILSPKETLDNLMDTHFMESKVDNDDEVETVNIRFNNDNETQKFIDCFDIQKVATSLASFGP